jgi:hypothetical protein
MLAVTGRYGDQGIINGINRVLFFTRRVINGHFNINHAAVKGRIVSEIDVLPVKVKVAVAFHQLVKLISVMR